MRDGRSAIIEILYYFRSLWVQLYRVSERLRKSDYYSSCWKVPTVHSFSISCSVNRMRNHGLNSLVILVDKKKERKTYFDFSCTFTCLYSFLFFVAALDITAWCIKQMLFNTEINSAAQAFHYNCNVNKTLKIEKCMLRNLRWFELYVFPQLRQTCQGDWVLRIDSQLCRSTSNVNDVDLSLK